MNPSQITVKKTAVKTGVHQAVQSGKRVERAVEEETDEVEEDDELANLQASEDLDVSEVIQNMVKNTRAKRASQRNAILKAHDDRVKKTHNNIVMIFDKQKKSAAAIREQHNQRLVLLLNRKAHLEAELSIHLTKLQRAYLAHSQDLQNVLEARARTLEHPTA
ncbi:uncharacterized protein K441DRAFT_653999 [Cenococcum geophilum 1.58]|uniref:uncharacterized protein n=1 Tax=Cenococcum geophilum 1.58 TaxID=794803 RepID=UPI00358E6A18|nr:hypothetical protein K441DRAFT_653999 [Cenococcum geophilum 1.58]